jgi:hypothetical protein
MKRAGAAIGGGGFGGGGGEKTAADEAGTEASSKKARTLACAVEQPPNMEQQPPAVVDHAADAQLLETVFELADADHDGRIDREEFDQLKAEFLEGGATLGRTFSEADADSNGGVEKAEFVAALAGIVPATKAKWWVGLKQDGAYELLPAAAGGGGGEVQPQQTFRVEAGEMEQMETLGRLKEDVGCGVRITLPGIGADQLAAGLALLRGGAAAAPRRAAGGDLPPAQLMQALQALDYLQLDPLPSPILAQVQAWAATVFTAIADGHIKISSASTGSGSTVELDTDHSGEQAMMLFGSGGEGTAEAGQEAVMAEGGGSEMETIVPATSGSFTGSEFYANDFHGHSEDLVLIIDGHSQTVHLSVDIQTVDAAVDALNGLLSGAVAGGADSDQHEMLQHLLQETAYGTAVWAGLRPSMQVAALSLKPTPLTPDTRTPIAEQQTVAAAAVAVWNWRLRLLELSEAATEAECVAAEAEAVQWASGQPDTALVDACGRYINKGDLRAAGRLLAGGRAGLLDKEARGKPAPLCLAAGLGHLEMVRLLLDAGASIDRQTNDWSEQTALWAAANSGQLYVLKLLLDRGANRDLRGRDSNIVDAISPHKIAARSAEYWSRTLKEHEIRASFSRRYDDKHAEEEIRKQARQYAACAELLQQ